jgi:hypothetical protein
MKLSLPLVGEGLPPKVFFYEYGKISKNLEAKLFFEWLHANGVNLVRVEALERKLNGERGAPLGAIFMHEIISSAGHSQSKITAVAKSNSAIYFFDKLTDRLLKDGKQKFDLQTSIVESEHQKSRALLVDDLDARRVLHLKEKWTGSAAILETSRGNFQAILLMDSERGRDERVSIERALVALFDGDIGAVNPTQLHRLPGSVNWKKDQFVCQLTEIKSSIGPSNEIDFLGHPKQSKTKTRVQRLNSSGPRGGADKSNSGAAFGRVIQMKRENFSDAEIIEALSRPEWLRHHSPDWPERTLRAASIQFRPPVKRLH